MTNAEAIETLRANYPDDCFVQLREAVDAAIEALKAQLFKESTTSDLISRQAAIDRFNVIRPVDPKKDEYTKGIDVGIAMCIVAVKDQPTIQHEQKEGHWKKDEKDDCPPVFQQFRICSVCGAIETSETNYCPKCGAKMTISTK